MIWLFISMCLFRLSWGCVWPVSGAGSNRVISRIVFFDEFICLTFDGDLWPDFGSSDLLKSFFFSISGWDFCWVPGPLRRRSLNGRHGNSSSIGQFLIIRFPMNTGRQVWVGSDDPSQRVVSSANVTRPMAAGRYLVPQLWEWGPSG